jgi:hypothetical protein
MFFYTLRVEFKRDAVIRVAKCKSSSRRAVSKGGRKAKSATEPKSVAPVFLVSNSSD